MKKVTTSIAAVVTTTAKKVVAKAGAVVTVAVELFYVEVAGVLYSIKPKDYAVLAKTPTQATLTKYFAANVLKHNPTCVFNSPTGRKSFEERRPMIYLQGGKLISQAVAAKPETVAKQTNGGKTIQVAQTGPLTIYVRQGDADTRPFSLKPEQFEQLKSNKDMLKFMSRLKHLPTCVEMSKLQGLISTETARPMYNLDEKGKLTQILTEAQAKAAAAKAALEAKPKAQPKVKAPKVVIETPAAEVTAPEVVAEAQA